MSVAELKLKAVEGLMKLNEEKAVEEILQHIEQLNKPQLMDADALFDKANMKYGKVLEKLAQ
jgi:NAD(P)H-hydrate repair Nnr-like enzyme with NAD(P)H-hydrate dehydratase domain